MFNEMEKVNITTIVGTRPEIIRLSSIIKKIESTSSINHTLIHTGQNYDFELNEIFFRDLGLRKPDHFLDVSKKSALASIGEMLIKIEQIFSSSFHDAILILGDTNSCLVAIAAKKYKIPVFHMEAGNRCFDQRVPEETNRKIVDTISDINLTYSDISREYLVQEGFPPERVIKTGSPMAEVLHQNLEKINDSDILDRLNLEEKDYFLVSVHREENVESNNFVKFLETLNALADLYKRRIIVSTHPRTRKKIDSLDDIKINNYISFLKPLGFFDYNKLQLNSKCVLSDSGTISEESSILKFPALNLREAHERPEAMEQSSVMMVGMNKERILQGIEIIKKQKNSDLNPVADYMDLNVSEKIIRIILSYIDYVNKRVYMKEVD